MGLVLDSDVLIAAERQAKPISEMLNALLHKYGQTKVVASAVTVLELEHAIYRAPTHERRQRHRDYLTRSTRPLK